MSFFWKTYLSTVIFWFYVNETYLTTVIFWLRKCFILFHNKLNWIALIFRKYFDFQNLLLNSSLKFTLKWKTVWEMGVFFPHMIAERCSTLKVSLESTSSKKLCGSQKRYRTFEWFPTEIPKFYSIELDIHKVHNIIANEVFFCCFHNRKSE